MQNLKNASVNFLVAAGMIVCILQYTACQNQSAMPQDEHPAEVVEIPGSDLSRVTLSERAAQRIDLKTDQVRESAVNRLGSPQKIVPYSSLIYDQEGRTWVYTSPKALTFVRHQVEIDYIEGDIAVLKEGPPIGTVIASVGVAELYGAEFKVGH